MVHLLKKARHAIYQFGSGYYNLLLMLLFWLFVFRPYQDGHYYVGIWKIILITALMMAIFNVHHSRSVKISISILAIPAVLFTWFSLFFQMPFIVIGECLSNALFMIVCAGSILKDVVIRTTVSQETLKGVISAYFLVAFIFAYIYLLIEVVEPGSIAIRGEIIPALSNVHYYFAIMIYYSFVTFLTIGYGDIVSIKDASQTATIIQGIIGQFYMVILVARLVSIYTFFSDKRLIQKLHQEEK